MIETAVLDQVQTVYRGFHLVIAAKDVFVLDRDGRRVLGRVSSVKQARLFVRGWLRAEREEPTVAPLRVCPRCGTNAPGDEPDCGECGYRLYPRNIDRGTRLTSPDPQGGEQ